MKLARELIREYVDEPKRAEFETAALTVEELKAKLEKAKKSLKADSPATAWELARDYCKACTRLWRLEYELLLTIRNGCRAALDTRSSEWAAINAPRRELCRQFREKEISRDDFIPLVKELDERARAEGKSKSQFRLGEIKPLLHRIAKVKMLLRALKHMDVARFPLTIKNHPGAMPTPLDAITHPVPDHMTDSVDRCQDFADATRVLVEEALAEIERKAEARVRRERLTKQLAEQQARQAAAKAKRDESEIPVSPA